MHTNTLRFRAVEDALHGVDLTQPASAAAEAAGAPASGTGETPPVAPPGPSAGTQNADMPGGTPPESVPYSRFSEVVQERNLLRERVAPFEELAETGYTAEELRRLADWETQFAQDPVRLWFAVAQGLDLPEGVKQAIVTAQGNGSEAGSPATPPAVAQTPAAQPPKAEEVPEWGQKLLEKEKQREEQATRDAQKRTLDSVVQKWKEKDTADMQAGTLSGETDLKDMLTYIAAEAENASSVDEIVELARAAFFEARDRILRPTVTQPGERRGPLAVPGGAAPAGQTPQPPKTMAEATALAKAAIEAGHIKWPGGG